jgi:hypothetical protein
MPACNPKFSHLIGLIFRNRAPMTQRLKSYMPINWLETFNFHINLEIILKHLGVFDEIAFEIAPISKLPYHPDCRHVTFRASKNVGMDRFTEIIRCLDAWIGFNSRHWWFGSPRRRPQSRNVATVMV